MKPKNSNDRMSNYKNNRSFSDKYISQMMDILRDVFIKVASLELDCNQATDLVILKIEGGGAIACRVRKYRYYVDYPNEFTIRCGLPGDKKTELHKIMAGYCDYFLYGFLGKDELVIRYWLLGSFEVFRNQITCWLDNGMEPWEYRKNSDGTEFYAFDSRDFQNDLIKAAKDWGDPPITK